MDPRLWDTKKWDPKILENGGKRSPPGSEQQDFTDFGKLGSSTTKNFLGRDMLDLQWVDIDEGRGRGW